MGTNLKEEFEKLARRSRWLSSFKIDGEWYGNGLSDEGDVRPRDFSALVPQAKRILELGSCEGAGTFALAKLLGATEIVAIEGRDYHVEKAQFVQKLLGG